MAKRIRARLMTFCTAVALEDHRAYRINALAQALKQQHLPGGFGPGTDGVGTHGDQAANITEN